MPEGVSRICLIKAHSKTLVLGYKNSVIPDDGSVTEIDDYAFGNRRNLTDVIIPDKVTSIGQMTFSGHQKLTIHAHTDSCAEQYVKENNIPFSALVIRKKVLFVLILLPIFITIKCTDI